MYKTIVDHREQIAWIIIKRNKSICCGKDLANIKGELNVVLV
jgi:hypothetical protein